MRSPPAAPHSPRPQKETYSASRVPPVPGSRRRSRPSSAKSTASARRRRRRSAPPSPCHDRTPRQRKSLGGQDWLGAPGRRGRRAAPRLVAGAGRGLGGPAWGRYGGADRFLRRHRRRPAPARPRPGPTQPRLAPRGEPGRRSHRPDPPRPCLAGGPGPPQGARRPSAAHHRRHGEPAPLPQRPLDHGDAVAPAGGAGD